MPYHLKNFDWYALKLNLKPALTLEYSGEDFPNFEKYIPAMENEGFTVHCRDIASRPLKLQRINAESLSHARSRYQIFISRRKSVIDSLVAAYDKPDLRAIGILLGYPRCCVEFYFARADSIDRDRPPYLAVENDLIAASAPRDRRLFVPPMNFLTHYDGRVVNGRIMLNGDFKKIFTELFSYSLTDHCPCSLSCRESAARGKLVLDVLRKKDPAWADRAAELAGNPVLYLENFRFFILKSEDCDFNGINYSSVLFSSEAKPSELGAALKRGRRAAIRRNSVIISRGGREILKTDCFSKKPLVLPFHK